jgi:hypothetical protein
MLGLDVVVSVEQYNTLRVYGLPGSCVMVIRAIVEHGQIRPLEPLPSEWVDGRELRVLEAGSGELPEEPDTWCEEMDTLAAELNDPEDWARIEAALAEADIQARSYVKREMGLR